MKNPLDKEQKEKKLISIFEQLALALAVLFSSAPTLARIKARVTLSGLIKRYGKQLSVVAERVIPEWYREAMHYTAWNMARRGLSATATTNIVGVHKQSLKIIAENTTEKMLETMRAVRRNGIYNLNEIYRMRTKAKLVSGVDKRRAVDAIAEDIQKFLESKQVQRLVDVGGKNWSLGRYAEMAVRTTHQKVHNQAVMNVALDNGYNLVQVSDHARECQLCRPWENKVLSITGAGKYPSVEEATASGLFHPNCKHSLTPISAKEALQKQ